MSDDRILCPALGFSRPHTRVSQLDIEISTSSHPTQPPSSGSHFSIFFSFSFLSLAFYFVFFPLFFFLTTTTTKKKNGHHASVSRQEYEPPAMRTVPSPARPPSPALSTISDVSDLAAVSGAFYVSPYSHALNIELYMFWQGSLL